MLCIILRIFPLSFFLLVLIQPISAQYINESVVLKQNYDFVNPIDIPMFLSGNFGEPRSTHFHTGLDIRTAGRIGLPIKVIEDGYVSRIGVSGKGYGKVLYITHPQHQLTSVYAHLEDFHGEIKSILRKMQYATSQSEIDTMLPKNLIVVKKGDIIALSGNTGGSGGPHLHFEIRDSKNDEAINPELVGFKIKDVTAPSIFSLKLYDLGEKKLDAEGKIISLRKANGAYSPSASVQVNSKYIGLSVQAIDKSFNSIGRNGIYQMKLYHNHKLVFESKMNRIHFEDWRYSYSYSDCGERMKRDAIYHKCFVDECNEANIYEMHENRGIVTLKSEVENEIDIELLDFAQNTNRINLKIDFNQNAPFFKYKKDDKIENYLDCKIENLFEQEDIKVIVPVFCLADNIKFGYSVKPSKIYYSDIHQVHRNSDPLLDSIFIQIKARNLPAALRPKAMLGYMEGGVVKTAGGEYKAGYVSTWFAKFTSYFVTIDTTPPKVISSNIINHRRLSTNMLSFRITDYLSGIKKYNVYLDGEWTPMDYDQKSHHLFYKFEKPLTSGTHDVLVELVDFKNNTSKYKYTFLR